MTPSAAAQPSWQESSLETLGHAQRLWNDGAREQAQDLLRDALQAIERLPGSDASPAGQRVLLALLRERVRMDLAAGQHGAVLGWLRRFERAAQREPDLWALRGQAAQRIGQHGEAVAAYQQALKLQAGEPRWMLAIAVSLAAQGQGPAAAEWVEQARALGPVSADVLAYLRQAGVPIR